MFPLKAAQPKLVWGGFGCDGITLGRFSFSVCTKMVGIANGFTLDRLIPHLSPLLWKGGGLRFSLDAGGLPSMPAAFSAIRRCSEGGLRPGGGVKEDFWGRRWGRGVFVEVTGLHVESPDISGDTNRRGLIRV